MKTTTEKMTAERRAEIAKKFNVAPAAMWCWTDRDFLRAEANGVKATSAGVQIKHPEVA